MTHPDANFTRTAAALVAANDRVPEQRAGEESPEIAIRRAAMPLCQERHPDLMLTGFFVDGEFVAACAECQAEVRRRADTCAECGAADWQVLIPAVGTRRCRSCGRHEPGTGARRFA